LSPVGSHSILSAHPDLLISILAGIVTYDGTGVRIRFPPSASHERTGERGAVRAGLSERDYEFESGFLQRRVLCEPDSLDQDGENLPSGFKLASSNSRRRGLEGVSITDDLWRSDAIGRRRKIEIAGLEFVSSDLARAGVIRA
jgi:hypothetical protein